MGLSLAPFARLLTLAVALFYPISTGLGFLNAIGLAVWGLCATVIVFIVECPTLCGCTNTLRKAGESLKCLHGRWIWRGLVYVVVGVVGVLGYAFVDKDTLMLVANILAMVTGLVYCAATLRGEDPEPKQQPVTGVSGATPLLSTDAPALERSKPWWKFGGGSSKAQARDGGGGGQDEQEWWKSGDDVETGGAPPPPHHSKVAVDDGPFKDTGAGLEDNPFASMDQ